MTSWALPFFNLARISSSDLLIPGIWCTLQLSVVFSAPAFIVVVVVMVVKVTVVTVAAPLTVTMVLVVEVAVTEVAVTVVPVIVVAVTPVYFVVKIVVVVMGIILLVAQECPVSCTAHEYPLIVPKPTAHVIVLLKHECLVYPYPNAAHWSLQIVNVPSM